MNPKSTALVLIEYQNDFTTDGGTLHGAVKPVMDSTQMLTNSAAGAKAARELGVQIVHVPISFSSDYRELAPEPYGILKAWSTASPFKRGVGARRSPTS